MNNLFFDTCVYHQAGIDTLFRVVDKKNILFGSELLGAVKAVDPETGHSFDDTKRYIDALNLSMEDRHAIFEGNVRRVYPLARQTAQGTEPLVRRQTYWRNVHDDHS